jgi:hypothetical protein
MAYENTFLYTFPRFITPRDLLVKLLSLYKRMTNQAKMSSRSSSRKRYGSAPPGTITTKAIAVAGASARSTSEGDLKTQDTRPITITPEVTPVPSTTSPVATPDTQVADESEIRSSMSPELFRPQMSVSMPSLMPSQGPEERDLTPSMLRRVHVENFSEISLKTHICF